MSLVACRSLICARPLAGSATLEGLKVAHRDAFDRSPDVVPVPWEVAVTAFAREPWPRSSIPGCEDALKPEQAKASDWLRA